MRTKTITKTVKTVCGKTISFIQTEEGNNKMHNIEGPAVIYSESENKEPEYYLYGVKYTKASWKSIVTQYKNSLTPASDFLDSADTTIYY